MPRRFVHMCQSFTNACCLFFQSNSTFLHGTTPGKRGMFQELLGCIIKTFSDFKHTEVYHPYSRETSSLIWPLWIHFTLFYHIFSTKTSHSVFWGNPLREFLHSVTSFTPNKCTYVKYIYLPPFTSCISCCTILLH